ncbi:hypothetical protein GON03_06840 [Nocardioides sp. MAH-18]|uniref:Uncharacterized protein n=1 Tax=Nocardioides agri TaxID=2682843 RepID=A0A6L6XQ71_9ACTN|nr:MULTISPECIES: hypothetical protein [unclassified Nocardioides]MBA2954030.1 hypothetical protein [Nocardioides sp. CGMCC 1.13656]MVQ48893.1 hypothetical protein [Nocardioides sp. MAH-18]
MRTSLAAVAAAALTLALAAPAHADRYGVDDPVDTFHGSDVTALTVVNGPQNLTITTQHEGLRPVPATGSRGTVFIDTDPSDRGPEFVLTASYTRSFRFMLRATDGFDRSTWGDAVEQGDYALHVDYDRDQVRVRISQAALGSPSSVRVAVGVSGKRTDGTRTGLTDWVGKPRQFSLWIPR